MSAITRPANEPRASYLMPGILIISLLTVLLILVITQMRPAKPNYSVAAVLDPTAVNAGKVTFLTVCAACHGPKATGINGLGKPLIGSAFFNGHTDSQLLEFLKKGRPVNDPLNTTGVTMPARGGRLTLTDTDLANVIAYIRSLNAK